MLGPERSARSRSAPVAVMPLARLQALAGLPRTDHADPGRAKPGREADVRTRAARARRQGACGRRRPTKTSRCCTRRCARATRRASSSPRSARCSGFLFAFNAILLTVPERRQAIADLRLLGTRARAIVQMVIFQALCLGLAASLVGLLAGYALAVGPFPPVPGLPRRGVHARHAHRRRDASRAAGARRRRARHLPGLGAAAARPAQRPARSTPSYLADGVPGRRARAQRPAGPGARRRRRAGARERRCSRCGPRCRSLALMAARAGDRARGPARARPACCAPPARWPSAGSS